MNRPLVTTRAADAALVGGGGGATTLIVGGLVWRPLPTLAALGALGAVAAAIAAMRSRHRLARFSLKDLLVALLLLLPLTALVGPSAALPSLPQLFGFRLLLIGIALLGVILLLVAKGQTSWPAPRLILVLPLWTAWLVVTMMWAPDKLEGFRYLIVFTSMVALTLVTAFAGTSGRRFRALCALLAVGYALTVFITLLEMFAGLRLGTSALVNATGAKRLGVTSFFYNQNNLAAYLAMCWPFLLAVVLVTRRKAWIALSLAGLALGLLAFVHTGSRSSLLVLVLETVVMAPFLLRAGSRRLRAAPAVTGAVAVATALFLAFNTSDNVLLRQFRLTGLVQDVQSGRGSGETRLDLLRAGLTVAGDYRLAGVGPGNAEDLVRRLGEDTEIGNLHNWWLEVLVDGGAPALALFVILYFGLLRGMARVRRRTRDPLVNYVALSTLVALIGYVIGSLGPSTAVGFAPMWILFGMALAVLTYARRSREDDEP